jgi:hypothetical protein
MRERGWHTRSEGDEKLEKKKVRGDFLEELIRWAGHVH